jgi:hypothetical protein
MRVALPINVSAAAVALASLLTILRINDWDARRDRA